MTLYIDLETRSRADLKKVGVYRYSEDPDFRVLMMGWSADGAPAQVAVGHDDILSVPGLLDPSVTKVAHNVSFDRVCLAVLDPAIGDPEQWLCTAALAAEYGRPVSLSAAARALGSPPKDEAGGALIRLFTRPNRKGEWNDETTHPMEWLDFIAYCEQDVDTMVDVHRRLGTWPTDMERRVWVADQRINDRGMLVDPDLCRLAAEAVNENRIANKALFTEKTGVLNPGSVQQVQAWLKTRGYELPNLRAETVQEWIDKPDTEDDVKELLAIRQDLAFAAGGKFGAALDVMSPDHRIRGGFRFFGAHTGRWTGQRVQPQNLPRAEVEFPEASIEALKKGHGADPYTLKALVRSMFIGSPMLTVVDYASIEARVLAWIANQEWALQAFRDGRDIYVETAERMSTPSNQLTRFQGKVAVLALGYNGGVNSLRAMGAEGDDETLRKLVQTWRQANPRITTLWESMNDAFGTGGKVGPHIKVTKRGSSRKMHLPSGRAIEYHGVKWEEREDVMFDHSTGTKVKINPRNMRPVGPGNPAPMKTGWTYRDPRNPKFSIGTYGGRLVENATQAIARDVLAEALVRLDEAGYRVIGHVHDEIIVESDQIEHITQLMTQTPTWGRGLPLDGEGFVTARYRKG